jgi:hypothetical protein
VSVDSTVMTMTPLAALQQRATSALQPGEEYLAAIRVEVPDDGRASRDAMFGVAVGSVLAMKDQKQRQRQAVVPITGAGAFIGITASRVLVFAVGAGLHPKELVGSVDRSGLTLDTEDYRSGLMKRAHVRLLDGDRVIVDAACSAKNPDLDALRELVPAAS